MTQTQDDFKVSFMIQWYRLTLVKGECYEKKNHLLLPDFPSKILNEFNFFSSSVHCSTIVHQSPSEFLWWWYCVAFEVRSLPHPLIMSNKTPHQRPLLAIIISCRQGDIRQEHRRHSYYKSPGDAWNTKHHWLGPGNQDLLNLQR